MNEFILNGTKVDLIPAGFSVGGFFTQAGGNINGDTLNRVVSGSKYQSSRFGILAPAGKDPVGFSQGEQTRVADMPLTGTDVKYSGDYAVYKIQDKTFGETGTIDVTVNFADKKLSIKPDNHVTMNGNITGNAFTFDDGKGKGQFYGSQAAELGGVHKNDKYITAFGAKK